ncbi:MAG: NAD(P)/FAD-dependent oxidoreductase [Actinomycetota bacterium]|nr:NAD(P)/FAD-dependent oxidoreductase [Actinomycetota bacterium]
MVIIGAGFSGIGLAVMLKRVGIDTFTVYEQAERVGGAWWHNQYPGAEVDSVSYIYSYAFRPKAWTRTHARQAELQAYLEDTVEHFGIGPHIQLGVGVVSATWDDCSHTYRVELTTGERTECHLLVGATGFLNIPNYPTWPGLEAFRGPKFHTSRWEPEHDLRDKTVAVVGTGSTASQLVPELAGVVGKLYLFQREPGWIVPKGEFDYSPDQSARFANPLQLRLARLKWFYATEKRLWRANLFRPGTAANEAARQVALAFIDKELGDRPDLVKAVTPDYPYWGKRLIMNSTFYASLKDPRVELIPRAVASVTPTGVVDVDGVERQIDVLIMATGFRTTDYLGTFELRGADGRTLNECWGGEPSAFLGMTVPNFPNFYIMYGPGTNGGEIVSMLMRQAEHIVKSAKRMVRHRVTALEVRPAWARMYDAWLSAQVDTTTWAVSHNYYKSSTGKIITQWPYSPGVYGLMVRALGRYSQRPRATADISGPGTRRPPPVPAR